MHLVAVVVTFVVQVVASNDLTLVVVVLVELTEDFLPEEQLLLQLLFEVAKVTGSCPDEVFAVQVSIRIETDSRSLDDTVVVVASLEDGWQPSDDGVAAAGAAEQGKIVFGGHIAEKAFGAVAAVVGDEPEAVVVEDLQGTWH